MGSSFRIVLAAALMSLLLSAGASAGASAAAGDAAAAVPGDAFFYAELDRQTAQGVLETVAAPPVAGVFEPRIDSPFSYLNQLLNLPPMTVEEAAPHLEQVGLGVMDGAAVIVLTFDGVQWPESLLQGGQVGPDGTVELVPLLPLAAAARDRFLIAGTSAACERIAAGDYQPLRNEPGFARNARAAAGSPIWAYLRVPHALRLMRAQMTPSGRDEFDTASRILGIDLATDALLVTSLTEGDAGASLTWQFADAGAGLLTMAPPGRGEVAADVPGDAAAALMASWGDGAEFLPGVRDYFVRVDRQVEAGQLAGDLAEMEAQLGMTLDQVFAHFDAGMSVYFPRGRGGSFMAPSDWTAILRLKDPEAFRPVLSKLTTFAVGQEPAPHTHDGIEMFRLPFPPVFGKFVEDAVVLGGSAEAVARHLTWRADPARSTLAGEVPPAGLAVRLDFGWLLKSYPRQESGARFTFTVERDKLRLRFGARLEDFQQPLLSGETVVAYTGVMAAMLMPALARARTEARKATGRNNLHQIGLGIAMWRNVHDDQWPPDLETLVRDGYIDTPEVFVDPADENPERRGGMGFLYSYQYVGPLPEDVPADMIICYSRAGVHADGRNVLYVDNAVMWVPEGQLHRAGWNRRTSLKDCYDWLIQNRGHQLTEEDKARLREFHEVDRAAAAPPDRW